MEPTQRLRQAVKDYREGKAEAFTPLYEESNRYIYTCIYKVMEGNDNAQDTITDMMQDTYLEISKSISQLEDEERFLQWAGMIATRKCYAYLKKNKKYVLLKEEDSTFDNLSDSESIIPEEVMQDKEKQRLVREIIEKELTEMQKLCLIAFYYNQQKQSEIAQELGIPENTVKTNLSRARAKIKEGVLDLEKKDGIRLHSVAPLLLLLFKEDVQAMVVPTQITESVLSSVAASAGTKGAGGLLGKITSASMKTKVIGGIVGIAALGAIGGTMLMANQNKDTWESEYREFLLSSNEASGFDLNDFDEDGTPEMLILEKDGDITVYQYQDKKVTEVYELAAKADGNKNGIEESFVCKYAYGMGYDEILEISDWTGSYEENTYQMQTAVKYKYQNGALEQTDSVAASLTGSADNIEAGYYLTQNGNSRVTDKEEGAGVIQQIETDWNEIKYTELVSEEIDKRLEEFKERGNRQRKQNETIEKTNQEQKETEQEEIKQEKTAREVDAEVSAEEKEAFKMLAQFITATKWGEDIKSGESIYPEEEMVFNFIVGLSNENLASEKWPYDKYLPKRTDYEFYNNVFSEQSIREYIMTVFRMEVSSIQHEWLTQNEDLYFPLEYQYSSCDVCEIERVDIQGNTYYVHGTDTFGQWNEEDMCVEYLASYSFEMALEKDEKSPFGFVFQNITYEPVELALKNESSIEEPPTVQEDKEELVLSGNYKSNRGHTLEFSETGTVCISEGGGHTWCSYTIDADGNIIISTDNETIEATYYEEEDKVTIYGRNYRRDY